MRNPSRLKSLLKSDRFRLIVQCIIVAILACLWLAQPDRSMNALKHLVLQAAGDLAWLCWLALGLALLRLVLALLKLDGHPRQAVTTTRQPPDDDPLAGALP